MTYRGYFSMVFALTAMPVFAAQLLVGGASISITPDGPVALEGQMATRIAREVEAPVMAEALAIEAIENGASSDQVIFVACDLVAIRKGILEKVKESLEGKLDGFDVDKLILSATHTHTAPVTELDRYTIEGNDVIQPKAYIEFLCSRIAEAASAAWTNRVPAKTGWGLGHAVVAHNRRSVYADGTAVMYGKTDKSDFRMLEGYEDHGVEVLFFWDEHDTLLATAVNLACPAQEVEGLSVINADFWDPIRATLRAKYGEKLTVLGWTGAAGDQSPHLMFRKAAEDRMRELRGQSRMEEIADRVVAAWEEAYEGARLDKQLDVPFTHRAQHIDLPMRRVTTEEYENAQKNLAESVKDPFSRWRSVWYGSVIDRYEQQRAGQGRLYPMDLHVLRIGDIAVATNSFELFTDFGIQIKANSRAIQTFIIQLAGPGTYLPSERAVRGGGYSAIVESSVVGPDGGQVLAGRTIAAINALFPQEKQP